MRAAFKLNFALEDVPFHWSIHFVPRSSFPLSMSRYVFPLFFLFEEGSPLDDALILRFQRDVHVRLVSSYVELAAAFYFASMKLKVHFLPPSSSITVYCLLRPSRFVDTQVPAIGKLMKIKLRLYGPSLCVLYL